MAQSGLITLKLEEFAPPFAIEGFDLSTCLFKGLVLREKDFREQMAQTDWSVYGGKYLAVYCTADAIIPVWAYMLITSAAQPFAEGIYMGTPQEVETSIFLERIRQINPEDFKEARVVVKGCSDRPVPEAAYMEVTRILRPVVKSLMYGEPCSTVPVYKKTYS